MKEFFKKQSVLFWITSFAALLNLIGFIISLAANNTQGYAYTSAGTIIAANIFAVIFFIAAATACVKFGNDHYVTAICGLAGVVLAVASGCMIIGERADLVAALTTYDSMNTIGWSVFYTSVVALAFDLVGALLAVAGAFFPAKAKKAEQI